MISERTLGIIYEFAIKYLIFLIIGIFGLAVAVMGEKEE